MHDHRRLLIWRRSYGLTLRIYRLTAEWPSDERYGLTSQLRRAAVSVPSNIAEGTGQSSPKGFGRYLRIALGSISEIDTQLRIARDLGYIEAAAAGPILTEVAQIRRMLKALIRSEKPQFTNPAP